MSKSVKMLLLVEDNPGDVRLLREMLYEQSSYHTELTSVGSIADAATHLAAHKVDLILLDLGLPDARGQDAVRRVHALDPHAPLVVLTGLDDEVVATEALKHGAQDYLIKGQIDGRGLLRAMRYSIERKIMDEALFGEKERAQVTLKCIADAVASTDLEGRITFLNQVGETMTGWTSAEAEGRLVTDIIRIIDSALRSPLPPPLVRLAKRAHTEYRRPESILIKRDGTEISIEDSIAPIHDSDGNNSGAVIVFRDVSADRAMARQLAHSAQHDFLTGLPNRLLLVDRIESAIAIAPRHNKKVAVLFLDLDGFKHINDSLGHAVGDKLLQSISRRLVDCVRVSDTVSRQGGDEFVVLLSEVESIEDASLTARRLLHAVSEPHDIDDHELHVTTSIGVSVYPEDGADAETLVKSADTAMYAAKSNGRHGYQFFMPAMNVQAVERQSIEESLRRALERQEFALLYQPKINLWTGAISGVEALIRWQHPTRGPLEPAQFIPVAEACGMIRPIGNWAMGEACRQAQAWISSGLKLPQIAVNVSASEFRSEGFLAGVTSILAVSGLDPAVLELELTESVLMKQAETTVAILRDLRAVGVRVAVDDFGTGYSSLSYLRKFPIDTLKIDQTFIRQISEGEDTSIVLAVLNMARGLGLQVVAEGVETKRELSFLQTHRCDEAQGFYFSKALPPRELARVLRGGILPAMAQRLRDSRGTPSLAKAV